MPQHRIKKVPKSHQKIVWLGGRFMRYTTSNKVRLFWMFQILRILIIYSRKEGNVEKRRGGPNRFRIWSRKIISVLETGYFAHVQPIL